MRLGETCVVAATFQEARHFTPSTDPALPRPGRAHRLRLRPRRGSAGRAAAGRARRRPCPPTTRCAASGTSSSSARTSAPRCWPATSGDDGPGPGAHLRVRADLRPRHGHPGRARAAVTGVAPRTPPCRGRRRRARRRRPRPPVDLPPVAADGDALLRSALAATTSGVTIADMRLPDQPLVYVNEAFEQLAGLPRERGARPQLPLPAGPGHRPRGGRPHPRGHRPGRGVPGDGAEPPRPRPDALVERDPPRPGRRRRRRASCSTSACSTTSPPASRPSAPSCRSATATAAFLARIEELAYTDPLTGLPNRRRLEEQVETAIWDARSGRDTLALLFVDLNGFKAVNDGLGHAAGRRAAADGRPHPAGPAPPRRPAGPARAATSSSSR